MEPLHSRGVNSTLWAGDDTFGPQVEGQFDFTLFFEHTILTGLPASICVIVCPFYIFRFLRRPIRFKHGLLLWAKLVIATTLLGVEVANAALTSRHSSLIRNNASIAAAALSCVSIVSVIAIIYAEHRRSLRSSSFLSAFLSITTLFNIARARSYISRGGLDVFGGLQVANAVLKLALISLEEISRQSLFQPEHGRTSIGPETQGGFWSRSLFIWINNTLFIGFRNVIAVQDLPEMGLEFSTQRLSAQFQKVWGAANKASRYCLPIASMKALAWPLIAIVVPRLFFTAFTFAQPFLLHTIVRTVGQQELSKNVIGGLIGATGLVYFGLAVTRACYTHAVYRTLTMFRGMLVAAIFEHTLELDSGTAKKAAAVTLMSTDVDNIGSGFVTIHDLWAGVIELSLGVYLLARYVGAAAFLVAIPTVVSTLLSHYFAKKNGPARKSWNQALQQRVSAANHILSQVKGIKMMGLAPFVAKDLQGYRVAEVEKSKQLRKIIIYMHALAQFFNTNTPVLVIAGGLFWTRASRNLDAADAFATISLTRLVASPMSTLLVGYPQLTGVLACFARIQDFLLLKTWPGANEVTSCQRAQSLVSGKDASGVVDSQHGVELHHRSLADSKLASGINRPLIELKDASIAPAIDADAVLEEVNVRIMPSTLTVIVGPVASGKTTLLRALMGEAHVRGTAFGLQKRSTGYCDQVSWLRNVSIRENIIGPTDFDRTWYESVLSSCLLDADLRQISEGDQALAGSAGANLSGGQKQRVALARAIYARKNMLIMDDVFSALDYRTSHAIMNRLLGQTGLLRTLGTTVVVATHSLDLLEMADKVLILDGKGNLEARSNTRDMTKGNILIGELRMTKAILEDEPEAEEDRGSRSDFMPQVALKATTDIDNIQKRERQRGDLGLYRFYFVSSGLWNYIAWMFMSAINMLWGQMPSIFLSIWLAKAPDNKAYFAGYATLGVTCCLSSGVMLAFYMLKVAPSSAERLHWIFLQTVMGATLGFLSSTDSGSLLNRFSQDMSLINQSLPLVLLNFAILFFDNVVVAGIVASGSNYAAIVIPFLLVTIYLIQHFYLRTSRQMRHLDLEAKSPLYTEFSEAAAGVQHIRAFSWQSETLCRSFKALDTSQKPYYYMFCIQRWLTLVLELSVMVIAVVLVTLALNLPHTSSATAIGLAMLNMIGFGSGMANVMATWTRLETSLGAIARLRSFLTDTPTEKDPSNESEVPVTWPEHGRVEIRSLSARYNPGDTRQVLSDLSLIIEPGQKVGVVGRTGSGKSSLVLALLHLLDQSGSVVIDNVDTSEITRQHLRSKITVIAQDSVELPGTVRYNLIPFESANTISRNNDLGDASLQEMLSEVELWDHVSGKGGLDAEFSIMGFSQGQKQLFCLARAVLHHGVMRSKIVLVDEATSNVDIATDRKMQAVMASAFSHCTVFTVAHRLETIQNVDILLELNSGKLVRREDRNGPGHQWQ